MFLTILLTTVIAIEGGMGSGKSTLCDNLNRYSNRFRFFPEAMQYLDNREYDELWKKSGSTKALKILFNSEERRKSDILRNKYDEKDIVVLDRSYLTFAAYEYAKGNKKGLTEFYRMFSLYKDKVMIPKYIIFLMVNPDIRIQRITHRGDKDLPDYSMVHKKFNDNLMQYFRMQSHVKVFFIDTTSKTPDNVLSEALNIIESQ